MDEDRLPTSPLPEEVPGATTVLRGWRSVGIAVAFFAVQIVIGIAVGIGMGIYTAASGGALDEAALAHAMGRAMLPAAIAGAVVSGLVAFWMTRRTLRGPISSGGLASVGWRSSAASQTVWATVVGCFLSALYVFVLIRISPPAEEQLWGPLATAALSGGWPRHLWALLAVVIAPPVEEFVFRGVLLEGLSNSLGVHAAGLIVTVAFVIVHASEALAYWPAWVAVTLLSMAALLVRIRMRSLVPAISVHAAYNLGLVAAVYSGIA